MKPENVKRVLIKIHDSKIGMSKEQHGMEDKYMDDEQQQQQHPRRTILQAIGFSRSSTRRCC